MCVNYDSTSHCDFNVRQLDFSCTQQETFSVLKTYRGPGYVSTKNHGNTTCAAQPALRESFIRFLVWHSRYDNVQIRRRDLVWPFDPCWSTIHTGWIPGDASSSRAEQNVDAEVKLFPLWGLLLWWKQRRLPVGRGCSRTSLFPPRFVVLAF